MNEKGKGISFRLVKGGGGGGGEGGHQGVQYHMATSSERYRRGMANVQRQYLRHRGKGEQLRELSGLANWKEEYAYMTFGMRNTLHSVHGLSVQRTKPELGPNPRFCVVPVFLYSCHTNFRKRLYVTVKRLLQVSLRYNCPNVSAAVLT